MKKYFSSRFTYITLIIGVLVTNQLAHMQSHMLGVDRPLTGFVLPTVIGTLIALLLSVNRIRRIEKIKEQKTFFVGIVQSLSLALDMRDAYTFGHSSRVTEISVALGRRMNLSEPQIEALELGCILHDVGKIGISDVILNKPQALTSEESSIIQMHPVKGEQILSATQNPQSRMIADCIRSHHERFDGKGYPDKLKGEDIPLLARIVAITDAFDAMISARPYRKRVMSEEQALEELKRCSGSQFDPLLVQAFTQMMTLGHSCDYLKQDYANIS